MAKKLYEVEYINQLEQQLKVLTKEAERMNKIVTSLIHKQSGQKKQTLIPSNQLSLFDEPTQEIE